MSGFRNVATPARGGYTARNFSGTKTYISSKPSRCMPYNGRCSCFFSSKQVSTWIEVRTSKGLHPSTFTTRSLHNETC